MAITYSVLGSIAAFTGSLFGAALQYPLVLVFIALIMILLSLSMFDVYELRMPAFLSRLAGGSQKGYLGTLFMGLTVGIVAAPCIGPFVLGLLTYVGNRGSVVLGFSLFFVLALALPMFLAGIDMAGLEPTQTPGKTFRYARTVVGIIFFAVALFTATSGIQGYLDSGLASGQGGAPENAIAWLPYSEERLAEAKAAARPPFIHSLAD